jgi:cytochrome c556
MRFAYRVATIRCVAWCVIASLLALAAEAADIAESGNSSSPRAVIETRKAGLKKMGAAMKTIVDQLKTAAPDKAKMSTAAQVISSQSEELPHWFPAGSGTEAGVETDALPYIWKDRAKFDSIAHRLAPESKTLAATITGNDLAAIKTQVKALSDVCSTCHRSFRAD